MRPVAACSSDAGAAGPLLLILDDLHWADAPTLSLLRHVVGAGASMRVMVVGTYRDSDLARDHPLTALLADLRREQGVERIKLDGSRCGGCPRADGSRRRPGARRGRTGTRGGRSPARRPVTRSSPSEMLRHLTSPARSSQGEDGRWRLDGELADLGLPQSVREVVGRRVERLGEGARTRAQRRRGDRPRLRPRSAARTGRHCPRCGCSMCSTRRSRHRCFRRAPSEPGTSPSRTRLVEHTLYEDLGRTRRALLHQPGRAKRSRGAAATSPASAWASSPGTGPRPSSTPTPPQGDPLRAPSGRARARAARPRRGGALVSPGARAPRPGARQMPSAASC